MPYLLWIRFADQILGSKRFFTQDSLADQVGSMDRIHNPYADQVKEEPEQKAGFWSVSGVILPKWIHGWLSWDPMMDP